MSKGDAFTPADTPAEAPDVDTFDVRLWIKGTAPVTRSVTVFGRPDLMGAIEELKDRLEEAQAAEFDDERPLARSAALDLAQQIDTLQKQMHASALRFRFRGLKNGELDTIREEFGREDDAPEGIGELDYRIQARQCIQPEGLTWEDFRDLHENLGNYFVRKLMKTANEAVSGGGVDVPFSSASSSLIATSSKN